MPTLTSPLLPALGDTVVHPDFDTDPVRDLLSPDRPLWTPRELRETTAHLATEFPRLLLAAVRYTEPQRWWLRLGLAAGVEVWLLSWTPGQHTAPHDHSGAAGSFAVLTGTLHEDYRYPGGPIRAADHHAGAGVGFGGGRAHQVRNDGRTPAASVHAYSPPLLPTRDYPSLADLPQLAPAGHRDGTLTA